MAHTATTIKMPGTPKPWMNSAMRTMMGAPGLRGLLGKSFATITVIGAKTGTRYSTPVRYFMVDDWTVILSQVHRTWWRNIKTQHHVELRIGRDIIRGEAYVAEGIEAHDVLRKCFAQNPRVAKFYNIVPDASGVIEADAIEELSRHMVAIVIVHT